MKVWQTKALFVLMMVGASVTVYLALDLPVLHPQRRAVAQGCHAPEITYSAGTTQPVTIDTAGKLCPTTAQPLVVTYSACPDDDSVFSRAVLDVVDRSEGLTGTTAEKMLRDEALRKWARAQPDRCVREAYETWINAGETNLKNGSDQDALMEAAHALAQSPDFPRPPVEQQIMPDALHIVGTVTPTSGTFIPAPNITKRPTTVHVSPNVPAIPLCASTKDGAVAPCQ